MVNKSSEQTLVRLFNENYIYIVEISFGNRLLLLGYPLSKLQICMPVQ